MSEAIRSVRDWKGVVVKYLLIPLLFVSIGGLIDNIRVTTTYGQKLDVLTDQINDIQDDVKHLEDQSSQLARLGAMADMNENRLARIERILDQMR